NWLGSRMKGGNGGNGTKIRVGIRVGIDPWVGCGRNFRLSKGLINTLQCLNIANLAQASDQNSTNLCRQGWKSAILNGFDGEVNVNWDTFVGGLKWSHVRLSDETNKLFWFKNPSLGEYIVRLDYMSHFTYEVIGERPWWWQKLWKVKAFVGRLKWSHLRLSDETN
ncbi:hypothetical protein KI387_039841, partial [Taxus chinensis]